MSDKGTIQQFQLQPPRAVSAGHGWFWINEGFRYFNQAKTAWILSLFTIVAILTFSRLVPFLQLIVLFVFPFISAGLSMACADIEHNKNMSLNYLAKGFDNKNRLNIFRYGLALLLMIFIVQIVSAIILSAMGVGYDQIKSELDALQSNPEASLQTIAESEILIRYSVVTIIVLIPVIAINIFAPVILAFSESTPLIAIKMSVIALLKNPVAVFLYGLILFIMLSLIFLITNVLGTFLASVFGNQSLISMVIYMFVLYTSLFALGSVSYSSAFVAFKDIFLGERS